MTFYFELASFRYIFRLWTYDPTMDSKVLAHINLTWRKKSYGFKANWLQWHDGASLEWSLDTGTKHRAWRLQGPFQRVA